MAHENATPRPWAVDPAGSGAIVQPLYNCGEYSGGIILYPKPVGKGWFIDSKTVSANAALIVEAVNAYDTLRAENERLREFVDFVRNAPVSSGVCCCGDNMDGHSDPMSCGHSPVDMWDHTLSGWIESLDCVALSEDAQ